MRSIVMNLSLPVDGETREFRLTKFDAFSGVSALRLVLRHMNAGGENMVENILMGLTDQELRSLMTTALNHTEVLLPAGYQPVMTGSDWGWQELRYNAAVCLKLAIECVKWSLKDFFTEGGSIFRKEPPAT